MKRSSNRTTWQPPETRCDREPQVAPQAKTEACLAIVIMDDGGEGRPHEEREELKRIRGIEDKHLPECSEAYDLKMTEWSTSSSTFASCKEMSQSESFNALRESIGKEGGQYSARKPQASTTPCESFHIGYVCRYDRKIYTTLDRTRACFQHTHLRPTGGWLKECTGCGRRLMGRGDDFSFPGRAVRLRAETVPRRAWKVNAFRAWQIPPRPPLEMGPDQCFIEYCRYKGLEDVLSSKSKRLISWMPSKRFNMMRRGEENDYC